MPWELLRSRAFLDLTPSSAKALPYFLGKVELPYRHPDRYKTEFSFSYTEAEILGFAPATFHKIISQLVLHGFIGPVDKGGLQGMGMTSSVFTLSWRWKDYGKPDFTRVEWRCFLPRYMKRRNGKGAKG